MIKISVAYQEILSKADFIAESALCPADLQGIYESGDELAEPVITSVIFGDWNSAIDYYRKLDDKYFALYPHGFITVTFDDDGKTDEKIFEVGKNYV